MLITSRSRVGTLLIALSVVLSGQSITLTTSAYAQSCSALNQQYAQLTRSIRSASKTKNTRSADQQRRELNAARVAYRNARCRNLFGHKQTAACVQSRSRIQAMERNLATLSGGGAGNVATLQRQLNAVAAKRKRNRCGEVRTAVVAPSAARSSPSRSTRRQSTGGGYRTLCVRACDGYYFPISFSTSKKNFEVDQARCQQMCPASPVELFVHRNPGEGPDEMTSLGGVQYTSLPAAFLYRTKRVRSCSCRIAGQKSPISLQEVAGGSAGLRGLTPVAGLRTELSDLAPNSSGTAYVPIPLAKLPADEDPETISNIRGELEPSELADKIPQSEPQLPNDPTIRLVGPKFFPDRSEVKVARDRDRAVVQ